MKKIAIILFALIATASASFAFDSPLFDFDRGNWSTYEIQADSQEVVEPGNVDAQVPGLYSNYSIDNKLIDTSNFDRSTGLEGFLAQLDQAIQTDEMTANASVVSSDSHI